MSVYIGRKTTISNSSIFNLSTVAMEMIVKNFAWCRFDCRDKFNDNKITFCCKKEICFHQPNVDISAVECESLCCTTTFGKYHLTPTSVVKITRPGKLWQFFGGPFICALRKTPIQCCKKRYFFIICYQICTFELKKIFLSQDICSKDANVVRSLLAPTSGETFANIIPQLETDITQLFGRDF